MSLPAIITLAPPDRGLAAPCSAAAARRLIGFHPPLTALANEAPSGTSLIGLGNELALTDDGWALIPYGDHPNDRGLQRFGRPEAERMVGYFRNGWNRIKRALVGMPIFRGHPDMADTVRAELKRETDPAKRSRLQALINDIERRYPDRTVYGTIADMEARDAGLALKLTMTEAGAALVNEEGLSQFSPHWLGLDAADSTEARPVKLPVYMCSIGLTARPNIPGTSLVNSRRPDTPDFPAMNKTLIIQLLAALGRPLANEATDEQINSGLTAAVPHAQSLAARPEATALANEQSRVTQLTTDLQAANTAKATAETALANERTAHAATVKSRNEALVDGAVRAGRITEAAKPVWLGRLERDFAVESVALANEQGAMKTRTQTVFLGQRKTRSAAGEQFTALVNERMTKTGEPWQACWEHVKASAEGKKLFEQMGTETEGTAAQ